MRALSKYLKFDFQNFSQGKEFLIANSKYNETKGCVTLDVMIAKDPSGDNLFNQFKVHCIQDVKETDVNKYIQGKQIVIKSVGKCSVYGDYSSNLSIEAVVEVK